MATRFSWKLSELVIVLVLAVALGVLWWGWTLIAALASPLSTMGLNYLLVGFWFTGGTLVPFLIRRPGAALLGEVAAAFVEGFVTQWGITAVLWGLVQGVACELVFAAFGYRRYSAGVLVAAGALAGVFSYALDFFYSHYAGLELWVIVVQVTSIVISGAVLGGLLAFAVGRGIIRTGVLRNILPEPNGE